MKSCHPQIKDIWYRNSFYFGYWKFLSSDIDITIVFEHAHKKDIQKISRYHAYFRRFFPIIGELVIFSEAHQNAILKCVNYYELQRDPILVKRYQLLKSPDEYEKIIFLHKFLISNWHKSNIDAQRSSKVQFYSSLIGLSNTETIKSLPNQLSRLLKLEPQQFKIDYQKGIDSLNRLATLPISNITYCLFYNNLCYLKIEKPLNETEKIVLERILLWELWGFFSYQASIKPIELEKHFERITDQLSQLTSSSFANSFKELALELELINK
jgi:hypothetical protein